MPCQTQGEPFWENCFSGEVFSRVAFGKKYFQAEWKRSRVKTARSGIWIKGCIKENLEWIWSVSQKQERELFWSVSSRKMAVKKGKAAVALKNAKRANILIAERRVGPMDQMEPQNLESADSHFADWYRFKIIYRRKVPDSDSTSESRKPKRHGSVLKPLDSKAY